MGGAAFTHLPPNSFPRLPPPVYEAIKDRFFTRIQQLYPHAVVPKEAPQKTSHGDLDILVCGQEVPHALVQHTLGASHVIPMPGNRTSNYAVPIQPNEWGQYGCLDPEKEARLGGTDIFYQVDIHVCADKDEYDRIHFFHGYGDLGMILGLMVRNNGLHLGEKGLRIPDAPFAPFPLSAHFGSILEFMGLSMNAWHAGFETREAIYDWCTSSRFFNPRAFSTTLSKVKSSRGMYHEFLEHVQERYPHIGSKSHVDRKEEALAYFGLTDEYHTMVRSRQIQADLKALFNGKTVSEWAGLGTNWGAVKNVMDEVRRVHGGEDGIKELFIQQGKQGLQQAVAEAARNTLVEHTSMSA